VGARVVPLSGLIEPGEATAVRLVVDEPIVSRAGDRFVLRGGSPVGTLGGGVVTDPLAPPRARAWTRGVPSPSSSLTRFLAEAGAAGVDIGELPVRLGVPGSAVEGLLRDVQAWRVEDRAYAREMHDGIAEQILATLSRHHADNPLASGVQRQWLRSRIRAPEPAVDAVLARLSADGGIAMEHGEVRLAGFSPRFTERQRRVAADAVARIVAAGVEPPTLEELCGPLHVDAAELAAISRVLTREGALVAVESNRLYAPSSVAELTGRLATGMQPGTDYGPAELREFLGLTRKFLIPFLEFCDRAGYTVRNDAGRRQRGTELAGPS
jgi:selenocysteine-specific elongation factor